MCLLVGVLARLPSPTHVRTQAPFALVLACSGARPLWCSLALAVARSGACPLWVLVALDTW